MLSDRARVVIGTLLYTGKFEQLDDVLVDRRARALIEEPLRELTVEEEYRAIDEALRSGAQLTSVIALPDFITERHSEQDFRDFLRRLLNRLDTMRPWPEAPHREVGVGRWRDYRDARVVGRASMNAINPNGLVNYVFTGLGDGERKLYVLILRLRSGDEVALAGPWWPDSTDTAVLSNDSHRSAEDIVAALVDGTKLTAADVVPVTNAPQIGGREPS